jgi:nicotinamidase-related amidase
MNSPVWVRKGIGNAMEGPGQPYQDPAGFDEWLRATVGTDASTVVLAGLSLDACILCTAQELTFRGYDVRVLKEATDTRSGRQEEKERMISSPPVSFWSRPMEMKELMAVFG